MKMLGITGFILLGLCLSAFGQVQQVTGGSHLDANSQLGGSGINQIPNNPYRNVDTGMSSIVYSRGLSGFKGNAPSISNLLSINPQDNGVTRFTRQSVGLNDVRAGGAYLYDPKETTYYNPRLQTLSPRSIQQAAELGQVPLPGESTNSRELSGVAKDLYLDATADYKPMMVQPERAVDGDFLGIMPVTYQKAIENEMKDFSYAELAQRGGEGLYGMLYSRDRERLTKELQDLNDQLPPEYRYEEAIADERVTGDTGQESVKPLDANASKLPSEPTEAKEPEEMKAPASPLPSQGDNVYLDLLLKLREQKLREDAEASKLDEENAKKLREWLLQRQDGDNMTNPPVKLTKDNKIIITRLAGSGEDLFNRYMRRGRTALRAGRFIQAAHQYDMAIMTSPKNPLAHIGACYASFMAGEWMLAARKLETALQYQPALMRQQFDLAGTMKLSQLQTRLTDLDNWVEKVSDLPELRMLLAFMYANSGEPAKAKAQAKKILDAEPRNLLLKSYADYLVTGKMSANDDKKPAAKKE